MFRGRYEHHLDAKGRLALPAPIKKVFAAERIDQLVVTTDLKMPCLVAYSPDEWAQFEARLANLPQFDEGVALLRRLYVGGAMDCGIDKQGRVLVPPVLREHAGLERDVYWVGGIRTLEIWSKDLWAAHVEPERKKVDDKLLARLSELGI